MRTDGADVFTGISRRSFERMKNDLRELGVDVPDGDACVIHHRGVSGSIEYSEHDRRVEVRILSKPFFVSRAAVTSMLERIMQRYTGTARGAGNSA